MDIPALSRAVLGQVTFLAEAPAKVVQGLSVIVGNGAGYVALPVETMLVPVPVAVELRSK